MRSTVSLLCLPVLLFAETNTALPGRWKSADVSADGIRAVFEFGRDNRVDSYSASLLTEHYRLVGTDTIFIKGQDGREQKLELEWDNENRANIDDEAAGKNIEMSRLGKRLDPMNQLVGEWQSAREWKGKQYPARAIFFADGHSVWIVQLRMEHGQYSIKDQTLRIEMENRTPVEGAFSLLPDQLMLTNPRGGQSRFERMEAPGFVVKKPN